MFLGRNLCTLLDAENSALQEIMMMVVAFLCFGSLWSLKWVKHSFSLLDAFVCFSMAGLIISCLAFVNSDVSDEIENSGVAGCMLFLAVLIFNILIL